MGLKLCYGVMDVRRDAKPRQALAVAIPQLLETWLEDFFAPRVLHLSLDGAAEISFLRNHPTRKIGTQELWQGEIVEAEMPLTRCGPQDSMSLAAEVKALVAAQAPEEVYLYAEGPLYHCATQDGKPQWYGRWFSDPPPVLSEIVKVRVDWSRERRNIEVSFPQSGYPLTSTKLLKSGRLVAGDPAMAAANRALIIPALARACTTFGLTPEEVRWRFEGEYAWLYPQDARALKEEWLPRLSSCEQGGPATVSARETALSDASYASTEEDVAFLVDVLAQGDRDNRAIALKNIAGRPTGDRRVRQAVEARLEDTTPAVLQIPYRFGEMRLLAGVALAAERWAAGDGQPVRLRSTAPITTDQLERLRNVAGLDMPPYRGNPLDVQLELYALLRERRLLPEIDLQLRHPVHLEGINLKG